MGIIKENEVIFKHKDELSVSMAPPEPTGGYSNEVIVTPQNLRYLLFTLD